MEVINLRQIGGLVTQARKAKGLTQRSLADESGVSARTISSLEMGDANGIAFDKLMRIFEVLDLQMSVRSGRRVKLGFDELPHDEFDLVSINDTHQKPDSPAAKGMATLNADEINGAAELFTDFSDTLKNMTAAEKLQQTAKDAHYA